MISVCAVEAPGTELPARCGLPIGHDGTHQVYYRDRLLDWPGAVDPVDEESLVAEAPTRRVA